METKRFTRGGEWRKSDLIRPVINPWSGAIVGMVCQASAAEVDLAIGHADKIFPRTRRLSPHQRWEILSGVSTQIAARKEEFAQLITAETGKPVTAARSEVDRAVFTFQIAAEESRRIGGDLFPLDLAAGGGERLGIVRRMPLGPVAGITPFNFPLNLVAHKVAPAIAAGNPIILKPSSNSPMVSLLLAEIVEETALPRGALQVLPCLSGEAGQLIEDERIKLISFTGSPAIGWGIKRRAGKKRVVLELGGNAGVIVDRDADLEKIVPRIIWGAFGNAGQSCIAVQRVFVQRELFQQFSLRLAEESKKVVVGDPADERTLVGPMITEDAARNVAEWIAEALGSGAKILAGGGRKGALLEPTVLTGVRPEMKVCSEEVFAPVVTVEPFESFSGAIAGVNRSRYGLQAGVFTNTLDHVLEAFRELEVGGVIVNDVPTYRMDHMPYGGVKDSGFGREGVRYAIESMSEMKLLALGSAS